MAKNLDQLSYKVFEGDMKESMKPSLLKIKEESGYTAYFEAIRNTIAGCKLKWKTLPQEVKKEFAKRVKKSPSTISEGGTSEDPSSKSTYIGFRKQRFEELQSSELSFADKAKIVS